MCTDVIVIFDVVAIVEVWCWVHGTNADSIDMQLVFQIINLLMNSFITSHVHKTKRCSLFQKQLAFNKTSLYNNHNLSAATARYTILKMHKW